MHGLAAAALLVAAGCPAPAETPIDAAPPPDAYIGPATALFELPRDGVAQGEYYALPFPNDLRVRADGRLDLDAHPRPNVLIDGYLDLMAERFEGFGLNQAVFARFDAPIDTSTLPATPEASLAADASVYLVDVDDDSPARGTRTPLRFRFEHFAGETIGDDWLSSLPYPGFTLRPSTTYALVVTSRLRATDGSAVARAGDLDAILGDGAADDAITAARAIYAPLLAYLDEPGGDERADVISAAVFTTQDPTALMGKMRETLYATRVPPVARGLTLAQKRDGFTLYDGLYDGPIFQSGASPYLDVGGEIQVDEQGRPLVQRLEPIQFSVSLPDGPVPAGGWPVLLYGHGTTGSHRSFVNDGTAARFAAVGIAVIGIDQVLHGPRYDGSSDPTGTQIEIAFYNFQNPLAGRDNSRQGGADYFSVVRLAENLVVDERHPGGRRHRFDADRIYYMGHSQGGITGPLFLAYEPKVKGAVLSGAGGLIYYALLFKTEPVDIPSLVKNFIRDEPLDEFNNMLALVQMYIDPADPINYARLLPQQLFQSQGLIDTFTPVQSIAALGVASGGHLVAPVMREEPGFALAGRQTLSPPVSGNGPDGRTVVFLQYTAPPGTDGHFVVFNVPEAQTQHVQFIATLDETGTATLVSP